MFGCTKKARQQSILEELPEPSITSSGKITDLHETIARLADGETLMIPKGTYHIDKKLTIDRNIQLVGETGNPDDVVIESTDEACLFLSAENARVEGLTLKTLTATESKRRATVYIIEGRSTLHKCNITSKVSCGVVAYGNSTDPTLTSCKVFDSEGEGMTVWQGAKGTYNNCEVFGNAGCGMRVHDNGNPKMTECKFYNNKQAGIAVYQRGKGTFDHCDVYGNISAGIHISGNGTPSMVACKFYDNDGDGIGVFQGGQGTFDGCEAYGNTFSGITIRENSNPKLTNCKFYDNKQAGIGVVKDGKGTFDNCEVFGNTMSGILVIDNGAPTILNSTIKNNQQGGIFIRNGGRGTYEMNTLADNVKGNWILQNPGKISHTGNTPDAGVVSAKQSCFTKQYPQQSEFPDE